jgi:PKD repeat protein
MKKTLKILLAVCSIYFANQQLFAQNDYLNCGSSDAVNKMLNANPQLKQQYLQREAEAAMQDREDFANGYNKNNKAGQSTIYIIPIVFHIINEGGIENISDDQVKDAVRVLNEDYRKLNATAANTVSAFQSIAADCEIEFRLAQLDPNGVCTNGIDRIVSTKTNAADDNSKLDPWPVNKYLNVWSVKTIGTAGVAGYAYLPGTSFPNADGVLILSNYIGSIGTGNSTQSHALSHEIGHFLNLMHPWGGTNNPGVDCSGSDNVSDTPQTEGWTTCNLSGATCGSTLDNVQNFMEYSYCPTMFTEGQKTRMRNALTSSVSQRSSLWTTSNLTATGVSLPAVLCHGDFKSSNTINTVCQGNSLTFTNLSWNGAPTSWSWTFQGGTPSTSTDSIPVIQYNTPGIYTVSLTVSNSSGSASATKTGYVTVNSSTAMYNSSFYSEGFEGTAIPNNDWKVNNNSPGGNTWAQTSAAASSGSKSVRIVNVAAADTYVDELVGPSVDMTAITGTPYLTFKVANAQRTSATADKLQVYISTNCGLSWALRKSITGAALSTGGIQTASFVPTASQWAIQNVPLSGYSMQANLFFMFRFTSNGGNNIYLDDINISQSTGIENPIADALNFNVYPNPVEENTIISFDILDKQKVGIKIYDIVGREVSSIFSGDLDAGEHQYSIAEKTNLSAGAYFVTLTIDKQRFTKKLIVK